MIYAHLGVASDVTDRRARIKNLIRVCDALDRVAF